MKVFNANSCRLKRAENNFFSCVESRRSRVPGQKQVCLPVADFILNINFLFKRFNLVNCLEQSKNDFWPLHHHYHS